jgi:hypothetical protein
MSLSSGAAHVIEMPGYRLSVDIHIEDVLRNAHSLNTGVKDVV